MEIPKTHYARNGEIAIAYQVHGEGEHDLVFSGTTASNVETVWALPEAHRFFERSGGSPGSSGSTAGTRACPIPSATT